MKPMPRGTREAGQLRIATYNIHKGISPLTGRNRIHDMRTSLQALQADIVFLQEVQGRSDRHAKRFANWPTVAQHDYLSGAHLEHAAYGRNAERADGDHGNAVLSCFPVLSQHNLDVSDHRFESRGLLHCEIDVEGVSVHCLCAHFGLFEGSRQRQAEALVERIRTFVPDDAPLIIAGDFNDWRNRLGVTFMEELGVHEAFDGGASEASSSDSAATSLGNGFLKRFFRKVKPARTFPSAFPMLRLDRVYLRGLTVRNRAVMHGKGWRTLSDHAPIVVDLSISKPT